MPMFVRNFSTYYSTAFILLLYPFGIGYCQQKQLDRKLGDSCQINPDARGECKLLENCPSVYNDTLADIPVEVICAYHHHLPVVCCPSEPLPKRAPKKIPPTDCELPSTDVPSIDLRMKFEPDVPGALASRKCAEYSKAAYRMVRAQILLGCNGLIKHMECAIKSHVLIVGGSRAEPREFPHMAAVGFVPETDPDREPKWKCGGTLISDEFVLTAAHCTFYSDLHRTAYWIRLGDLNIVESNDIANPQTIRIAEKIRHPNYDPRWLYHDIALFRLESKVTIDPWIRPACLVHVDRDDELQVQKPTQQVIATGWGAVDTADVHSDHLLKVVLDVVAHENCTGFWAGDRVFPQGIVDSWQICAGGGEKRRDTCQGDSGGPLLVYNSKYECMYDVIGVTSTGTSCGKTEPAIYTRVENYLSWLEETVWS